MGPVSSIQQLCSDQKRGGDILISWEMEFLPTLIYCRQARASFHWEQTPQSAWSEASLCNQRDKGLSVGRAIDASAG